MGRYQDENTERPLNSGNEDDILRKKAHKGKKKKKFKKGKKKSK